MKKDLFGPKVNYDHFAPPFVLVGLLNQFDNRYQSAADSQFGELTWKQMYFLHAIRLHKEAPTATDIAEFMGSSSQNANKLLAKMLNGEYVYTVQDEKDRRKQRIYLTEKAKDFLKNSHAGQSESVFEIFSEISPEELETTIDVMYRLIKRLEKWQEEHD
ncbi:MAG: MarR family transcriptional regulator [Eubacteriales bacterium]|nr:MarR family transcriptional regulator [Eubacteriales bacterium]